jgi:hypothetical protein
MPKRFMAIHGRKLQEEKFLSPIMRVYREAMIPPSAIVILAHPCH